MAGLAISRILLAFFSSTALVIGLEASVPAVYIFGDSTADVGNNNFLAHTKARANFPPNGIDFVHRRATGRFSNGLNTADFIAKKLGFNRSPPPFLSLARPTRALRGANFASAGSGIHEDTGRRLYGDRMSMWTQLHNFALVRANFVQHMGDAATAELLSKSIFFISTGTNDLIDFFAASGGSVSDDQKAAYVKSLVSEYKFQLQRLYKLGARKVGVISPPPTGCCPSQRAFNATGGCLDVMNELSLMFYGATDAMLKDLSCELKDLKYSLGNLFNMVSDFLLRAPRLGFTDLDSACCGTATSGCVPNSTVCSDRKQYLFWDSFHPTQAACGIAAETLFTGPKEFASPINFGELAAC